MNYANFIKTDSSVTVLFSDASPVTIRSDNGAFAEAVEALENHRYDEIGAIVDKAQRIAAKTDNEFTVVNGAIQCGEDRLPEALSNMLFKIIDDDENALPLKAFWLRLKSNPSARSQKCLYDFLLANHCCVTEDGCFVGYKAVKADYFDKYTGTVDNSVGQVVEMDRSKVDDDPQHTCSHGYHVAAYDYAANSYGCSGSDRLMLVKVDPANVVAVPYDYNNTKIRVCKYEVIGELEEYYKGSDTEEISDTVYRDEADEANTADATDSPTVCGCGEELDECCEARSDSGLCCLCLDVQEEQDGKKYTSDLTSDGRIEVPRQALEEAGIGKGIPVRITDDGRIITSSLADFDYVTGPEDGRLRMSARLLIQRLAFDSGVDTFEFAVYPANKSIGISAL